MKLLVLTDRCAPGCAFESTIFPAPPAHGAASVSHRAAKAWRVVAVATCCALSAFTGAARPSAAQTISTVAGSGSFGFSGDGGPATSADLSNPIGVAVDSAGNFFIADANNHRIRRVTPGGIISTVAGNGVAGFGGDGGPATGASLNQPNDVELDGAGNLFIADNLNHCIRKVDTAGVITTVAGNGFSGFVGDGGPATSARLSFPLGVATDGLGQLFIADLGNHAIRKVSASGVISTVAGTGGAGFSGDGNPATGAALQNPTGIATDGAGNLFIADNGNERIRRVDPAGIITTFAGTGVMGFSGENSPATGAQFNSPYDVRVDGAGNVLIADSGNGRIRRVTPGGIISTFAGSGAAGFSGDGGPATSASLLSPTDMAFDSAGNLFIADLGNQRIRRVALASDPTGAAGLIVTTNSDVSAVDGLISLREAIINANSNADSSTITFDASVRGVVDLASALPPITTPTTVRGPGANVLSINRPGTASAFRLFTFNAGASRIQEITLSGGLATGTGDGGLDGTGGAVLVRQGTTLSLNFVHVTGNTALGGGGVENLGTLNVGDSTFSNNTATQGTGGAIHSTPVATSFGVSSSTFVGNRSADSGGAIRADTAGTFNSLTVAGNFADTDRNGTGVGGGLSLAGGTLINSLVVGNIAGANTSSNVAGTANTTSFNRITGTTAAAGLETDGAGAPVLKDNGGRTPTVALLAGSPAISAGNTTLNFDQRGVARPQGANDDIGAFEFNTPLVLGITRLDANPSTASSVRFRVEFSVSVLGVGAEDFAVVTTGGISGASVTGVTGNGSIYTVTVGGISGTGTLRLDLKASGTGITDVGGNAIVGGFTLGETYTRNGPNGPSAESGAIISEFRFRGKSGALDEYVELYNKRGGSLNISGWSLQTRTATGLQTTLVPDGKIIPPFGRYLFTGSGFSLSPYGTPDQTLAADVLDASGVALFNAAGAVQDAVGFTTSDAALKEGAGLPSAPTSNGEYAFVRDTTGTLPKDTSDSTQDFVFVIADADATTPTALATVSGTGGNVVGRLGAPSPEGIADPAYANPIIAGALLDPSVSQSAAPNRERVDFVPGTSLGALLIRRTITNNSGRPITKLRFSVASITSLGTPGPSTQADVRLVSSGNENVTIGGASVPVKGLTLETGAAGQPALPLSGGLGSSAVLGEVSMGTPLANGESRSVVFRLQIVKSGAFSVLFNFHAAPGS